MKKKLIVTTACVLVVLYLILHSTPFTIFRMQYITLKAQVFNIKNSVAAFTKGIIGFQFNSRIETIFLKFKMKNVAI